MKTKRIVSAGAVAIMGALLFSTTELPAKIEVKPGVVAGASKIIQNPDLKRFPVMQSISSTQSHLTADPNVEPILYKGPTEAIERAKKVRSKEAEAKLAALAAEQIPAPEAAAPEASTIAPEEQPSEGFPEEFIQPEYPSEEEINNIRTELDSLDELELLYRCVQAEAYTMGYEGMRVITDAILNLARYHGTSITETILTPGQFEVVTNGAIMQKEIYPDTKAAVDKELEGPLVDSNVMYFRTNHYHEFGTPLYNIGNVYFSTR